MQSIAPLSNPASVQSSGWTATAKDISLTQGHRVEIDEDAFFTSLLSDFETFVLPFHPAIPMSEVRNAIEIMSENPEARAFVYGLVAVTLSLTHSLRSRTSPESSDIATWVSRALEALGPVLMQENISIYRVATIQFMHVCFMGLGRYDIAFYYLRQSITMVEILRIEDSSSMAMLPLTERSQRQRLYWTVYVSHTCSARTVEPGSC